MSALHHLPAAHWRGGKDDLSVAGEDEAVLLESTAAVGILFVIIIVEAKVNGGETVDR